MLPESTKVLAPKNPTTLVVGVVSNLFHFGASYGASFCLVAYVIVMS